MVLKDPLLITREGIIIDGYARRELAEKQGISTLCCVELDVDEDEALRRILDHHRRSSGWNDYNRICMASKLRDVTRTRAHANQQAGGRFKASSKLTKAEKVSVRREIADAADVSEGSVTKVDQLEGLHPELVAALQSGEIRIHRAWLWRTFTPERQREQLRLYRLKKDLREKAKRLISKHRQEISYPSVTVDDLNHLAKWLSALPTSELGEYLDEAIKADVLKSDLSKDELRTILQSEGERPWNVFIGRPVSKRVVVDHIGRYIRKPPIAQRRLRRISDEEIEYLAKDTKQKCFRPVRYSKKAFVALLIPHVPDRYCNSMRYFGLLAPRLKNMLSVVFSLFKQKRQPRPLPLGWAQLTYKTFGIEPSIDSRGEQMVRVGRLCSFKD